MAEFYEGNGFIPRKFNQKTFLVFASIEEFPPFCCLQGHEMLITSMLRKASAKLTNSFL